VNRRDLERALACLRAGGVVACATETFVGLLADALDPHAVARVYALKGRAADNPIGVLLPDVEALARVAHDVPERVLSIARKHWPGPLTLVLPMRSGLPAALAKDGKIGARVPGPSSALELVRAFGAPLTATSANPSGQPAARDAHETSAMFPVGLDFIVPGAAPGGLASTVIDVSEATPLLLRVGPIALADL
jgi:L-threonylcarbamoyladenylate synthase